MNVNLETNETEYDPGDIIQFHGAVAPLLIRNYESNGHSPLRTVEVTVVVSLVDEEGVVLAAEAVQVMHDGTYSGCLIAPPEVRGEIFLIAEAAIDTPLSPRTACSWYGLAEKVLIFPLNLAPRVSLAATTKSNGRRKPTVQVNAQVIDPDRQNDIELITVTISDSAGRLLREWQANDFNARNSTWGLTRRNSLSGVAPWMVTLTAEDSVGNVATTSQLIALSD
jgi:hypothetical protein